MSGLLEVVDGGFGNTLQDGGRPGYRSMGVPLSGAADPLLLACANLLAGNDELAPGVELGPAGPRLLALAGPLRCALAGAAGARLLRSGGGQQDLPPWHTASLFPGDVLAVDSPRGPAYLAVSGGFRVPPQLGSCATYARAGLGGVDGRALAAGDRLPCGTAQGQAGVEYRAPAFSHAPGPLRVILGPQDDHFTPEALAHFLAGPYTVTRDLDRMGIRLEGPPLAHRPEQGADIVSEAVAPGAIQVPANGQPILLGPDCQTVGGYPKIATLIQADLPRLAHLAPGQAVLFAAVGQDQARQAYRELRAALAAWRAGIAGFRPPGILDLDALGSRNLVSGMIDARAFTRDEYPDLPWE